MIKFLLISLVSIFLIACEAKVNTTKAPSQINSKSLQFNDGLKDCNLFEYNVYDNDNSTIYIVRCPNSNVSTTWETSSRSGKTTTYQSHTTVVIDGDTYVKQK